MNLPDKIPTARWEQKSYKLRVTSHELRVCIEHPVSSIKYKGKKDLNDYTTELLREITELHRELDRMLRTTILQFISLTIL